MLYTLQVMCFLCVLTYPIAVHVTGDVFPGCVHIPPSVHVTGDVFPGCVDVVLPAGCGHVAHL